MKKIIYRGRVTGKISHDCDYDVYLRGFRSEEALAEEVNAYNRVGHDVRVIDDGERETIHILPMPIGYGRQLGAKEDEETEE